MTSDTGIEVISFCKPSLLEHLHFHPSFDAYPRYRPIITQKSHLIEVSKKPDTNLCLAILNGDLIVGISILEYPDPEERWARLNGWMMELSVVEVARDFREKGLSRDLLRKATEHPKKEEKIFYMVGFSWTWDLTGTGLSPIGYRELLIKIFREVGFSIYQTNEPNVLLRPENLFMARIGNQVPENVKRSFKLLRFGISVA